MSLTTGFDTPVERAVDDERATSSLASLTAEDLVLVVDTSLDASDRDLGGIRNSKVVVQQRLELEVFAASVLDVQVTHELVRCQCYDVEQLKLVREGRRSGRWDEANGYALVAVEEDFVYLPCLGTRKAMLR